MFIFSASLGNQETCYTDQTTYLTGKSGYISSTALESQFVRTNQCTFTITVLPGQTIDFSIFDFTLKDSGATSSPTGTGTSCPLEVVFTENRVPNPINLCNGPSRRQRHVYSSQTHRVVLQLTQENSNTAVPLFFLNYQGKINFIL